MISRRLRGLDEDLRDVLAVKRLTRLIVEDAIMEKPREWVLNRFPPEDHPLGYLITCHACTSVWAAALVRSRILPRWCRDILSTSEASLIAKAIVDDIETS